MPRAGKGRESEADRLRREASRRSLEQGGLPLNAIDRLKEQAARQGTERHFFTSDLSVNELTTVSQAGYEPLGQVMGSSVYHVGWQFMPGSTGTRWLTGSLELDVLTHAFYEARHLALGRMQQEAVLLGASGVVGVRLERKEYEWGRELLEFAAIGTAIIEKDAPRLEAAPWISDLSGEEFWTLRQSGYRPVGLAVGNCTYYCIPNWNTQWATSGSWVNQELEDYTQAVYTARALAMGRMEKEARNVHAVGVVGADVEVHVEPREVEISEHNRRLDMIYHFTAIGTAIAPYTGRWPFFKVQNFISLK